MDETQVIQLPGWVVVAYPLIGLVVGVFTGRALARTESHPDKRANATVTGLLSGVAAWPLVVFFWLLDRLGVLLSRGIKR